MALDYSSLSSEWLEIFMEIPLSIREELDKDIINEQQKTKLQILPPLNDRLNAFKYFNPSGTKTILIGQDPYQKLGLAMGLSFSVPKNTKIPPSLVNLLKELNSDIGCKIPDHGDLTKWAENGVLLLNTSLSVLQGKSNSHKKYWQPFIIEFFKIFSKKYPNTIYIMLGNDAKSLKKYIVNGYFIEATHPSPLAISKGGFFGSKIFSKVNDTLIKLDKLPINWNIN